MRSKHALVAFAAFGTLASHAAAEDSRAGVTESPLLTDARRAGELPASPEILPAEYPPRGAGATVAITGGAIFLGWYGGALASSYLFDAPGLEDLRYPVVGPWLSLRDAGSCSGGDCSTGTVVLRVALSIADGLGQIGGLGALAEGLFMPRGPGAPNTGAGGSRRSASQEGVRAAPFIAGRDLMGLTLSGAF